VNAAEEERVKRLAWVLGLALVAALATAGAMRFRTQSRIEAAQRRALAVRTRIAQMGTLKLRLDTYEAWKQDLHARLALIDRLRASRVVPGLGVVEALARGGHGIVVESLTASGERLELRATARSEGSVRSLGRELADLKLIQSFEVRAEAPNTFALAVRLSPPAPDPDVAELDRLFALSRFDLAQGAEE
jgi:Tfp pilus assembly protein PilN